MFVVPVVLDVSFSAAAFLFVALLLALFAALLAAACFEVAALLFFAVCFVCFVTGVTVAEAFGFAGGFRFVFGFGCDSSDSDEYIAFALLDGLDFVGDCDFSLGFAVSVSFAVFVELALVLGGTAFFFVTLLRVSESVDP